MERAFPLSPTRGDPPTLSGALRGDRPPGERPDGSPRRHLRERNRRHHGPQRSRGGRLLGGASLMNAAGRLAVYCAGLAVAFVSASVAAGAVIPAIAADR